MRHITCKDCGIEFETRAITSRVFRCQSCRDESDRVSARAIMREKRKDPVFREAERVRLAKYRKEHPEREIAKCQKRAAQKRGGGDSLTEMEWNAILKKCDSSCAYCGEPAEKLHRDHFIPLRLNGPYSKENIVPACPKCNCSKGGRHPLEWLVTQEHGLVKYAKITSMLENA